MDQTTINDIRQRVTRWQKDAKMNGKESERTWIFAVNIDDVELLLKEIDRLTTWNKNLQTQLEDCMEQLDPFGEETGVETDD